ncbi:hypothetical protein MAR_030455 [Mya arenaria]|uniref:Uncharacterized protein n=1 Tax=Mya arenaria TaxID=6604 RepID=A0ABY7F4Y3_MYAAR|nr:hypothetical protein MAR_030455 [Mya arenaria]
MYTLEQRQLGAYVVLKEPGYTLTQRKVGVYVGSKAVESLKIIPDEYFTPYYEVNFDGSGGRGFGDDYPKKKGVAFGLKSTKP